MGNGVLSKIQDVCVSELVNKYINIPLKHIWMNDYSKWLKYCEYDICFVFSKTQSWLLYYSNGIYIDYLRKKYPTCKIVLYLGDLISSYYKFDVNFFINKCDYVISYDSEDARKYHLLYAPLPYSEVDISNDDGIPEFDVFFCGKAKDRLDKIYELYDYLISSGMTVRFFVTGVDNKCQCRTDIVFNKKMNYSRYLQYMKKSKAIVEIRQRESVGDTLRVKEALTYGKLLITDNIEINTREYYNPNQIYIYTRKTGINLEKFKDNKKLNFETVIFDELYMMLHEICYKENITT
ncbi:hypothetical protein [Butyrivibrio sp. ob235]|uniref:hypothetical protein n=1 Tax=Butyrivibrio sp. ob235 TaxID=1761780 RepID=UPI001587707C|nr:hypothetical protein [Butyrivibrio sp. ob235]